MNEVISPTLDPVTAANTIWDAVIVGAGPAGSAAAISLARRGVNALLLDQSPFPRGKVCGCCLNKSALRSLVSLGLERELTRLGAVRLDMLRFASNRREAMVPLAGPSLCLSRETLDAAMVREAIRGGAQFLPAAHATLAAPSAAHREIHLRTAHAEATLRARVILAADGLGGHFLDTDPKLASAVSPASRMGAGACIDHAPSTYAPHAVHMAVARGGYVGLVRLEDGRLDIAAALDAGFVKLAGGPANAVETILHQAGFDPIAGLDAATWRGTPKLTRRRRHLGAGRLLVIGDAAGYVEPFTGEGIAWALASGIAVAPLALEGRGDWSPRLVQQWESIFFKMLGRRRRSCALVTRALRSPLLTRLAISLLASSPRLTRPLVRLASDT